MRSSWWWLGTVLFGIGLVPGLARGGAGPIYVQEHFRWRNDDGSESAATWKAAADTPITTVPRHQNVRLRFCVANTNNGGGNFWTTFQYATSTNGPWVNASAATNGAYAFEMADSPWYTNGASTADLLPGSGTYLGGKMVEYPRQGVDLSYGPTQHANMELCVRPTTKAKGSATYYFRLKDLTCNIACSQYAALTMAPGDVAEAPRIVSPLAATVTVDRASAGAAMAYQALASGSEPSTWEATPLPAGYGLFGNVITEDGTPSTPGTYNVTLTARNAYGSDTKTLALTVLNNQPPEMTLRISAEVGAPFLYTIRASGNGPMSNVITCVGSSELPFGLSYDGTNTIRGVPLEAGTSKLRVTAQNGVGGPACSMVIILAITGGGGPADADGDGMLDAWEIQYFGSTNAPDGAAGADADGDGMSNLAECRAGTNPKDPASVLAVSGAALGSGADQFVVSWGSVSGKSYGVDKRTNLVGAAWQVVAGGIPGSPPVNTYTDSVGQTAAGFYRVKVE